MDDGVSWNFDGRSTDGKRYRFVPGVSGLHRHRLPCLVTFAFHPQNLPRSISPFFPFPIPHPPIPSIVCSFFFSHHLPTPRARHPIRILLSGPPSLGPEPLRRLAPPPGNVVLLCLSPVSGRHFQFTSILIRLFLAPLGFCLVPILRLHRLAFLSSPQPFSRFYHSLLVLQSPLRESNS
jgi:hypothetical protein